MLWFKSKTTYLFLVLMLHITLLDLFFVGANGAVFLIDKNLEMKTIVTHLLIVCVSVSFYMFIDRLNQYYRESSIKVKDFNWIVWSVLFIFLLGFILI